MAAKRGTTMAARDPGARGRAAAMGDSAHLWAMIRRSSQLVEHGNGHVLQTDLGELAAMLGLALPPEHHYLGAACWFAGGGVLRWLERRTMGRTAAGGDRDFYFPSERDLTHALVHMLNDGCVLERVRLRRRWLVHRRVVVASRLAGGDGDGRGLAGALPPLDEMASVELRAPGGESYQLVGLRTFDSPLEVVAHSDLSICQFAMDAGQLYASEAAWKDALARRVRIVNLKPLYALQRLRKYLRRGYLPRSVRPAGVRAVLSRYVATRAADRITRRSAGVRGR